MREIKFRAFCGEKMMYPHGIFINGDRVRLMFYGAHEKEECLEYTSIPFNFKEPLYLMQFTGLKDCANRPADIYEGDIIKVTHFSEDADYEDMVSEVIFESGVFALKQRHIDEGEVCPLSCEEHYVVIGNIHENPELLKDTK